MTLWQHSLLYILGITFFAGQCLARTWARDDGKTVEADLQDVKGDNIVLQSSNRNFEVPIDSLTREDQKFIWDWMKDQALSSSSPRYQKPFIRLEHQGEETLRIGGKRFTSTREGKVGFLVAPYFFDVSTMEIRELSGPRLTSANKNNTSAGYRVQVPDIPRREFADFVEDLAEFESVTRTPLHWQSEVRLTPESEKRLQFANTLLTAIQASKVGSLFIASSKEDWTPEVTAKIPAADIRKHFNKIAGHLNSATDLGQTNAERQRNWNSASSEARDLAKVLHVREWTSPTHPWIYPIEELPVIDISLYSETYLEIIDSTRVIFSKTFKP